MAQDINFVVTTSFDSCRTDCLLVTSNLRTFTTELDTLIPYLLLILLWLVPFHALSKLIMATRMRADYNSCMYI